LKLLAALPLKLGSLNRLWQSVEWPLVVIFLATVAYFHGVSLLEWSVKSPYDFDAKTYYIPYAKRLLNEGISFLFTEEAMHIPPFSYIFPALFGGDLVVQKNVSIALSTLNILLLFRTGWLLHSRAAGLLAVTFYALSPSFKPFLATGSVEPLFIFLMAAWFWLLAEGWASQRRWMFLLAGVLFGLAALTRATILYFLPVIILAAYWMQHRAAKTSSASGVNVHMNWANVGWAHCLALAMVLPVLIKNMVMFGIPSISTGAGIALYLGNNPLTFGMDPSYFHTDFDNGAVPPPGLTHLAVVADRSLAAVGKYMLFSLPTSFVFEMYTMKLSSFFFVNNREWIAPLASLRGWRIFLIVFSIPALWTLRAKPIIWILVALLAYQVAAHLPVVYSHRYSVGVLEMALVLLAGVGLAVFLRDRRWVSLFVLLMFTAVLIYMGRVHARDPYAVKLNAYGVPHETLYSSTQNGLPIAGIAGAERVGANEFVSTEAAAIIDLDFTTLKNINRYTLQQVAIEGSIVLDSQSRGCEPVTYFYRKQSQTDFSSTNSWLDIWPVDGKPHLDVLGHQAPLEIIEPGMLRVRFTCGAKTRITLSRVEVLRPTVALYYRERYLKSIGARDWNDVPSMELPPGNK
jgi:Dolichyl-phosphate-mannose-protein mannosyltransferase